PWSWIKGKARAAGRFARDEIAPRAMGAVKVWAGTAAFVAGAALCETGLGCVAGGPLMAMSADVGASGFGQVLDGSPHVTVAGQLGGSTAQAIEEGIVGAAGIVSAVRALRPVSGNARPGEVWGLPPVVRGNQIEKALGRNLPANFPVIDRWANGVATSIKSIDLSAPTFQNAATLSRTVRGYIDKLAAFNGKAWGKFVVDRTEITGRALEIAIPAGVGTVAQQAALSSMVQYGRNVGVHVKIIPF
ncbi:MAG TPA: hypothetical protein VNO30_46975, partial [Kofleriaceae bacterium]|nr:hypothetical protein [Kofleriaceae bacterium]